MTGCSDVFMAGDYLRVTVGEDQLVVDCHRFPLCQRLNQQLLFDLRGESTQVISVTATDTVKSEVAHRNTHTLPSAGQRA